MKKVFLVPNCYKQEAIDDTRALDSWLTDQGYNVVWAPDNRLSTQLPPHIDGADLVVSLGGDGTLLRAVHLVGNREIPILGLAYGHLGFLTAASPLVQDVRSVVSDALSGEMQLSRRSTLACAAYSIDDTGTTHVTRAHALNDMALTRGSHAEMVAFKMEVSGNYIDRLRGDGVVVSTATGSTGYALSAGGPIVSPDYTGMICVPIAPHTIQARAFITSASDVIEIEISKDRPSIPEVAIDGQFLEVPGQLERVVVKRGDYDVCLLWYGPESFYASISRVFYGARRG
ncbi:NAD(+)/NADH kinase [Collinsella sp. zg1085]|uniref:NAD(+)/NADH kinase n=1 Tax=Collinsella sp. zg1085 TaxID=2844380 RepID=UPI001C0D1F94|nr:NAD(+)/NADH kinase [Collinsella sp. zg1085]QWT17076.1 NAD(+)/NADH kinase [Collinsella sp. zg1085]